MVVVLAPPNLKLRDKLQGKQALCLTQLEDNQQKMQGLGTLPHDQHEQYKVRGKRTLFFFFFLHFGENFVLF